MKQCHNYLRSRVTRWLRQTGSNKAHLQLFLTFKSHNVTQKWQNGHCSFNSFNIFKTTQLVKHHFCFLKNRAEVKLELRIYFQASGSEEIKNEGSEENNLKSDFCKHKIFTQFFKTKIQKLIFSHVFQFHVIVNCKSKGKKMPRKAWAKKNGAWVSKQNWDSTDTPDYSYPAVKQRTASKGHYLFVV